MKKILLLFIAVLSFYCFTSGQVLENETKNAILGAWIWQRSVGDNGSYTSTVKTTGSSKKLLFSEDGKITTYKNNIELRVSTYTISKGISVLDNQEHDLVTFEGLTYVIEILDTHNLTLTNNFIKGYSSIYKR